MMNSSRWTKNSAGFSKQWKVLLGGVSLAAGLCLANGCTDKQPATGGEPKQTALPKPVAKAAEPKPVVEPVQPLKTQTIDFANPGDQIVTNIVSLSATANSGLPVSFGGVGPCRIKGGKILTFTGTGTVTIIAVQPGNKEWKQAPLTKQSFTVRDVGE
jgi:hypothetical protein